MKAFFLSSLLFGSALLLLQGCATSKEPLIGQRAEILKTHSKLEKDLDAENFNVHIEDPVLNVDWSQSDYDASHKVPHLEAGDLKSMIWKTSIGSGSGSTGFLLATPLIEGDTIYTLDTEGRVTAKNIKTGKEIWTYRLKSKKTNEDCSGGGISLGEGRLFAAFSSSDVVALDTYNGSVLWHKSLPHSIRSAPTFYKGFLYLVTKNNRGICLKALTGEKIWQQEGTDHSCALLGGGKPAVQNNTAIIPYSSGELYALRRENGYPLWAESLTAMKVFSSASIVSHIKASPVIDGDMIFALSQNGRMVGINHRSGDIAWEREIRGLSTPVVHGSFIFVVTSDQQVICMVRDSGKIVWITHLPGHEDSKSNISYAGPLLAGNKLIVSSSEGKALFLNPSTGERIDQIMLPGSCLLPPVVANKVAYFLTENGTLAAFE